MQKQTQLVCFDIFDTLILRMVRRPEEVFGIMFDRNRDLIGHSFSKNAWIGYRRELENKARSKKAEADIFDIYSEAGRFYPDTDRLIEAEFEAECHVCILNPFMDSQIREEIHKGNRVALISDMYWPLEYIRKLLKHTGFTTPVDEIFVSCEYGCSKYDSGLFDVVVKKSGIPFENIIHIGDNIKTDLINSRRKGIAGQLYDMVSLREIRYPFLEMENETEDGIYLLPIRLMADRYHNEKHDMWHTIGAMIYGPFVVGALEWVIDTALKAGIKKIVPFMREGEFFASALRRLLDGRDTGIEVDELYISRAAMRKVLTDSEQEKNALKYFRKMGLDSPFITFDIGYAGTIASQLDELLDKNDIGSKRIHCLGLRWSKSSLNIIEGHDIRGFISAEDDNEWKDIIAWLFEMCFMCDKGRVCGYDENGVPETETVDYPEKQPGDIKRCQQGILSFVDTYRCVKKHRPELKVRPQECHDILSRFFRYPLITEVNTVKNIEYDENFFDVFTWKVIDDRVVERFKRKGFLSFEHSDEKEQREWAAGIKTVCDPCFSMYASMYQRLEYSKVECLNTLVRYIDSLKETEKFFVVGFGVWGRELLRLIAGLGKQDRIEAVIDNEEQLHGLKAADLEIIGLNESAKRECDNYLISVQQRVIREELKSDIIKINKHGRISAIWG